MNSSEEYSRAIREKRIQELEAENAQLRAINSQLIARLAAISCDGACCISVQGETIYGYVY